jgi:hypothetical protein
MELHIDILHGLPVRMGGACGTHRERRDGILVGQTEGRRPLDRPRRRCDDDIKISLKEFGGETVG